MGRFYQYLCTRWPDLYVAHRGRAALCFGSRRSGRLLHQLPTAVATKIKLSLSFCYIIVIAPSFVAGKVYLCNTDTKYLLALRILIK
jgi:hypothetical protein